MENDELFSPDSKSKARILPSPTVVKIFKKVPTPFFLKFLKILEDLTSFILHRSSVINSFYCYKILIGNLFENIALTTGMGPNAPPVRNLI